MGLLERALAGLGKGLADSGEMNLKSQIEELRMNRLAELQEARDSRKYERERTDKLSDFERQKAWDLEKMGVEYGYKAQLKGIGLRGRGGGGGDGGETPLLDTDGNPVVDPDTQEPIMVPRSGGSGGGGGRRGSGRSGKSGGSGGDTASAYNLDTDPETGAAVSINKITGAARPVTMRTPGEEFKPDTFGIADEQNLKQQNEAAQIEAAKRDGRPVNTAPGYRADDKVRVLKAEGKDKDKGEDRAASDAMTERRELFKLYAEDTKDMLPGKAPKFLDWLKAKGYPAPAGLLAGELSPRAEMRNAEPKSQTPSRSTTPSRSEQGRRALPPPAPGEVRETKKGRFRFLGGDVNDPKSWVKVD